ncbi:PREDICTED: solute carrier family 15 member 2 isoform X1 [Chrysochloris asiatica]|uniref:Solute carrier family 15 member 2 n=1 Tax=Chrysochloris asiatica TaxID=185453 RepID=A0A9B0TSR8_CHRAS|nr:PREDICTED: solute carrier family 15 member 2 isoform X1 [Chrysochloris asiatica]
MNTFQKNESKETLFTPVSIEGAPPRPPSPPKKSPPKICGTNYPLSIAFIVVNEFCERFSYYGMKAVLTLYFLYFLHWDEDTSTSIYHAFSSLCYFTPILGAAIADSWLGKFKTIIYLSLVYVLGHVIKSLGAIPIFGGQTLHRVLAVIGLSLIALGTGGIKPCVAAFGGDQFEEKHAKERTKYFSIFYLSINAGSLISTFITPMLRGDIQCFGEDCYALAFGIPGLLMVIALVVFTLGSRMYKKPPPEGNIVAQVVKCIWFAISNRFKNRSGDVPKRQHWLDWATEKYPKQLILDVKALTRVLFLYIPLPMFWALLDQQGSRWTLQATRMDGNLGFFVLQPDQMQVLNPLLVLIFIPLFDLGIYRLVSKCGINFTSIRKMAVGMILACLAFAVAAVIEIKINEIAPPQVSPQAAFLQVVNLADGEVNMTVLGENNNPLLEESIKSFQKIPHYSKLHLNTKSQNLHFRMKYKNFSVYTEHFVEEKNWYSLILHGNGNNISSLMVKNEENKTTNGMTVVRFVNTLPEVVNISLGTDTAFSVGEAYGVSAYRTVETGEYPAVHCKTKDKGFYLNLGRLDFGAAYLFVITKSTSQGLQAWKMEDRTASKMSIAWQLPQYALVTAAEVMFSVTGLEFSYSQAPSSMKSVLQAAWLLTVAIGNIIVLIVAQFSGLVQWAEFVLFSCLLLVVCLIFSIMGYYYVPLTLEEIQGTEDKQTLPIQGNMINLETKKTKL